MKFLPNVIYVYTDGGIKNNGKENAIGSHAYILHLNGEEYMHSEARQNTTSNQEELLSILCALEKLKRNDLPVIVFSDSQYSINSITKWIKKWKKNGWISSKKEPVKNRDILERLDSVVSKFKNIKFEWVRGHDGNEYNEKCHNMCQTAKLEFEKSLTK